MIDKLKSVEKRFLEINDELSLPEVVSDNEKFKKLMNYADKIGVEHLYDGEEL